MTTPALPLRLPETGGKQPGLGLRTGRWSNGRQNLCRTSTLTPGQGMIFWPHGDLNRIYKDLWYSIVSLSPAHATMLLASMVTVFQRYHNWNLEGNKWVVGATKQDSLGWSPFCSRNPSVTLLVIGSVRSKNCMCDGRSYVMAFWVTSTVFSRKKHLLFGGWFLNPQHAVTSKNRQPFNQRLFGETDEFSGGLPQSLPSFFPWGSCITKPITGGLPSLKPRFPGLTLANQRVGPLVFRHCAEKPVFSGRFKF